MSLAARSALLAVSCLAGCAGARPPLPSLPAVPVEELPLEQPDPAPPPAASDPRSPSESRWIWPVQEGGLVSGFGDARRGHRHGGIDIRGRRGQPVLAAGPGRVVFSGSKGNGYGLMVVIDHGGGIRTLYAHGSEVLVEEGDRVAQGQAIAVIGRTGNATSEHCHFELRRDGAPVDPLPHLLGLEGVGP